MASSPGSVAGPAGVASIFANDTDGALRDRVYRAIRAAILGGQLPPGEKITEVDLAEALRVSRTPLREAFRRLEAERLVRQSPSRGVVVSGLLSKDLEEIYEIRESLEPLAARLAAQRISAERLTRLGEHLELAEFFLSRQRWREVAEQEVEFHSLVYRAAGNTRLYETLTAFHDYLRGARGARPQSEQHSRETLDEHRAMLEALKARRRGAAARAAAAHLRNIRRRDQEDPR